MIACARNCWLGRLFLTDLLEFYVYAALEDILRVQGPVRHSVNAFSLDGERENVRIDIISCGYIV